MGVDLEVPQEGDMVVIAAAGGIRIRIMAVFWFEISPWIAGILDNAGCLFVFSACLISYLYV